MLEARDVISSRVCGGGGGTGCTAGGNLSGSRGREDTAAAAGRKILSVLLGTTGIDTGMAVFGILPNGQDRIAERLKQADIMHWHRFQQELMNIWDLTITSFIGDLCL
jgi:hypothetical protein